MYQTRRVCVTAAAAQLEVSSSLENYMVSELGAMAPAAAAAAAAMLGRRS